MMTDSGISKAMSPMFISASATAPLPASSKSVGNKNVKFLFAT